MKTIFAILALFLVFGFVNCNSRRSESKQNDQGKSGNDGVPFWAARGKRNELLSALRSGIISPLEVAEDASLVDLGEMATKERSGDGWLGKGFRYPSLLGGAGEKDSSVDGLGEVAVPVPLSWLVHNAERPVLSPAFPKGVRPVGAPRNFFGTWLKLLEKRNDGADSNNRGSTGGSGSHSQPEIPFWATRG